MYIQILKYVYITYMYINICRVRLEDGAGHGVWWSTVRM